MDSVKTQVVFICLFCGKLYRIFGFNNSDKCGLNFYFTLIRYGI